MTRTEIRLRTFWFVTVKIWWFRFLHRQVRMRKETFITLILFILLAGFALGMVWRSGQVEPRYQLRIATLEAQNSRLVAALGHMEALKAEVKNKRRPK